MFDNVQLEKAFFAKGNWNESEYLEVLARSFPNLGKGGASQFVTQSEVKLTKMVNLKTGEVITFK